MPQNTNLALGCSTEETCLLGLLLAAPHLYQELPNLHPLDFELPAHRLIWKALVALVYQDVPVSVLAVARCLAARGQLGRAGGREYLDKLVRGE